MRVIDKLACRVDKERRKNILGAFQVDLEIRVEDKRVGADVTG